MQTQSNQTNQTFHSVCNEHVSLILDKIERCWYKILKRNCYKRDYILKKTMHSVERDLELINLESDEYQKLSNYYYEHIRKDTTLADIDIIIRLSSGNTFSSKLLLKILEEMENSHLKQESSSSSDDLSDCENKELTKKQIRKMVFELELILCKIYKEQKFIENSLSPNSNNDISSLKRKRLSDPEISCFGVCLNQKNLESRKISSFQIIPIFQKNLFKEFKEINNYKTPLTNMKLTKTVKDVSTLKETAYQEFSLKNSNSIDIVREVSEEHLKDK